MIDCCKNIIDWNAVSAISNIVLAIIAVSTLAFSIYLMVVQNKQRKEDVREEITTVLKKSLLDKYKAFRLNFDISESRTTKENCNFHGKKEGKLYEFLAILPFLITNKKLFS